MAQLEAFLSSILKAAQKYPQHPAVVLSLRDNNHTQFSKDELNSTKEGTLKSSYQKKILNYKSMVSHSIVLAQYLSAHTRPDEIIAIFGEKNFLIYSTLLACMIANRCFLPLNPKRSSTYLKSLLVQAGSKILINCEEDSGHFSHTIEELNSLLRETINPKEIIENSCSHPESRLDTISTAGPENLCYILFSSGSTGVPKGICVTRRNFAHFLQNFLNNYSINCNDRISQTFGLSFDPALSDIFLAFTNGASLYPLLDEEIYNISNFICENKLTYWSSVPTLARLNTKRQKSFIKSKMNSLRYTTFTGEALEGELCKIWRESAPFCQIENLYGPTETTINICRHILKELSPEQGPIPIGQVYPDHRIALIDSELKQISAINTPGELIVQGPQVTQGYLNDTEETKAKFFEWNRDGHTWYRTGDLVFLDKNGMFVFKGRKDWQLKIAGMRIEPEEIEYVCAQAAPQTRFLAFGDSKSFPQQILGVIDRNLSDNEFESILKHCHKELPRIFVPKRIFFSPSFPTHPSGKIDRQKIEDLLHQGKLLEIWPPKKPHL